MHILYFLLLGMLAVWIVHLLLKGKGRGLSGGWDHLFPINRVSFALLVHPKDHHTLEKFVGLCSYLLAG